MTTFPPLTPKEVKHLSDFHARYRTEESRREQRRYEWMLNQRRAQLLAKMRGLSK